MIEKLSFESGGDRGLETLMPPLQPIPISLNPNSQDEFVSAFSLSYPDESEGLRSSLKKQCIKLDLENLKCFEVVANQFTDWGVTFTNAIALQPSNPAFPPHSGNIVLMGGPRNGWMEATFKQPVCWVSCFVTSSRQTVLSAYDLQDRLLGKVEIPESNLAGSGSTVEPNTQLCLQAPNIYRITFYAFDGQFSLDDFQVCFQVA